MKQALLGFASLWCRDCDHFWREQDDKATGWLVVLGDEQQLQPGHAGCPACSCIYVVWENYPEWMSINREAGPCTGSQA